MKDQIENILFKIGKEIKIHKLIDGNFILDIDYDKYVIELLELFNNNLSK